MQSRLTNASNPNQQGRLVTKAIVAAAASAARPPAPDLRRRRRRRRTSSVAPAASSSSASGGGDDEQEQPRPPHAVLGIAASASAAEARRAWRRRALEAHPDVAARRSRGSRDASAGGGEGVESGSELLELNGAYAEFLLLKGVRSRGAVGKRKGGEEDDEEDEDDDPFLPPLFSSSSSDGDSDDKGAEEEESSFFLFVDPFSVPSFDPFRWRELQALLESEGRTGGGRGERGGEATPETAADVALAALCGAGVTRMPPRQGVALLTQRQLAAVQGMIESSLEGMDFEGGAFAVSEALARARAANSGWRRRRARRKG